MSMKLEVVAQMIMDKFYQGFDPRDGFFGLDDFKRDAAITYNDIVNKEFQQQKKLNKILDGFPVVEMSPDLLIEEVLELNKGEDGYYSVTTSQEMFSFDYDSIGSALQFIRKVDGDCDKFIKIGLQDVWAVCVAPKTAKTFFYRRNKNTITFTNSLCMPKKVRAFYVPKVVDNDANCVLSENIFAAVQTAVLQLYFAAKSGMVIDKVNDGNRNVTLENQQNTER